MKLLKGKRMEPAITQWAYESSTFVALHGGLTRVLSALLGYHVGCYGRYLVCMFVNIKYERGILHGGR